MNWNVVSAHDKFNWISIQRFQTNICIVMIDIMHSFKCMFDGKVYTPSKCHDFISSVCIWYLQVTIISWKLKINHILLLYFPPFLGNWLTFHYVNMNLLLYAIPHTTLQFNAQFDETTITSDQLAYRESYWQFALNKIIRVARVYTMCWLDECKCERPHKNDKIHIESKTIYVNLVTQPIEQLAHQWKWHRQEII